MACPVNKIDSNITGLSYAEEECLKVLPGTDGADAAWYELEPNSYADFGGKIATVARNPINPSRQRKKGTVTDLDASGGFNSDFTQSNMTRLLQGFFFADAREKVSTAPLNGTQVPLTNVDGTANEYEAASGLGSFIVGNLVKASNFADGANNGLSKVLSVSATILGVSRALVDDATPDATAKVEVCGFEFPTGDVDIAASASSITLTSTATDFTTLGLNIGEWIFLGGDAAVSSFDNNSGYARISDISANVLSFDDTTWAAVTESGAGKEVQMFFGTVIRNEKDPNLIKRRSYNVERTLGQDANGTQSEYLEGAIPNEFTINLPQAEKLNCDLSFVAMDNTQRDGALGVKSWNPKRCGF